MKDSRIPAQAALYLRVSAEDQVDGWSLDGQLRQMRDYCTEQGWSVANEYIEPGVSGRTDDRPKFREMIAAAKGHRFDVILVHKFDRFARNREDAVIYKALLRREDVRVVSLMEPVQDGPIGKFVEGMLEVVAEWFSANLAQEVAKGKKERAVQGHTNTSVIPLGYRKDGDIYIPDPDTAPLVQEIFEMVLDGQSLGRISKIMAGRGQVMARSRVLYLLHNRFYAGYVAYHHVWFKGQHLPLIDDTTFHVAQERLHQNARAAIGPNRWPERIYVFSGLLTCAHCGQRLAGCAGLDNGKMYNRYRCHGRNNMTCAQPMVGEKKLVDQLYPLLKQLMIPREDIEQLLALEKVPASTHANDSAILRGELDRLTKLFQKGRITEDYYESEYERIQMSLQRIPIEQEATVSVTELVTFLRDLPKMWDNATASERHSILMTLFHDFLVDQGQLVAMQLQPDLLYLLQTALPPSPLRDGYIDLLRVDLFSSSWWSGQVYRMAMKENSHADL